MATTGILTPEQFELINHPHAYFEVTTDTPANGSYRYNKVYENDTIATYTCDKIIKEDEGIYFTPYFTVDKITRKWVYVDKVESTGVDEYLLTLNDEEKVTVDLDNFKAETTGGEDKPQLFINGGDAYELFDGRVPKTRKINTRTLQNDVVLTRAADFPDAIANTRKVNGQALTDDIWIVADGDDACLDTWTINGQKISSALGWIDWNNVINNTTCRYRHCINLFYDGKNTSRQWTFCFIDANSTSYTTLKQVASALYTAGYRTKDHNKYLAMTGYPQAYGVCSTDGSTISVNVGGWFNVPSTAYIVDTREKIYS